MFGMWSLSLCKSRDLGVDLDPRIPPSAWARKPNWLRCWLYLTDIQSFNSARIRWSVAFFFFLLSEVVRNRLFAFLSPSQSPLLRAWRLSRCWGCRHGAAETQGYGSWKPVLLALCSSDREDSEWNQDQGHRHQDLNSFLCSLCVREHGLRVHLQFLLYTKGCWESWVTQSQYNVWQHLPLKRAGMDTDVQLVLWRGCL